jgi:hypothetical protein
MLRWDAQVGGALNSRRKVREVGRRHEKSLKHGQRLRHQQPMAIPAVDKDAGDRREKQGRDLSAKNRTRPYQNDDFVSAKTNQDMSICCIQVPMSDALSEEVQTIITMRQGSQQDSRSRGRLLLS